ncbi:MAG: hypothetical protein CMJ68_14480 [Planctomycetaceae bacterium]|nr:hypothetical protein [Planctomycetaceae bacterium]
MIRVFLLIAVVSIGLPGNRDVLAADRATPLVLNNLVTEVVNARRHGLLEEKTIRFATTAVGWHHFRVKGPATLRLDDEIEALCAGHHASNPEAMRYLAPGDHRLSIQGKLSELTVRRIPTLQHAFYNAGDTWNVGHGPFDDWNFLKKHVLPNINVILSGGARTPFGFEESKKAGFRWISNAAGTAHFAREDHVREWKRLGRRWLTSVVNPFRRRQKVTVDEAYDAWAGAVGLNHPLMDGVIVDEFGGGDQPKYGSFRKAIERIYANPKFKGKTYSPYSYGSGILSNDLSRDFARASAKGGGHVCIERYLIEQPTREAAEKHIHEQFHSGWNMPRYEQDFPGVVGNTVMVLGYMSAVGESLNVDPSVDFKVYMDLQMHALATQPAYAGLGGIQQYTCSYADEETIRWASRLFRHYAIEGKTNLLSDELGFRYRLAHIQNPDFANSTSGWTTEPAEPDSLARRTYPEYGYLQFRYNRDGKGDSFLWTRRSPKRANVFSQDIKNLVPGRLYSLKMVTADHGDLVRQQQARKLHAVSVEIENVEILPGKKKAFQAIFPNHYARPVGEFRGGKSFYMNYHWRVFRAKQASARLTVTDWKDGTTPGGPIGQELMFNFIEVQPYFAARPGITGKPN